MATIEIDGKIFEVENGKMIIEVADEAGIHIPRFCYHKKLSVAANCRMCLVAIENSKKTVPACATPISQGMKVFTKSEEALKSQKIIMEFLLINHPLDCPICDQGGECELQDVSMGFGDDHSNFGEPKRSVDDTNLGSLISTEMTRCIHCTRCVRFGEEIAGLREMGAPFRGEDIQIGTYVESSIRSEISGNIIDLCPVGALTSKPYRYAARSWELVQKTGIAPHDCLGSNLFIHTRRGKLMRVIPKECEAINETWISDRDRFAYTGVQSDKRLAHPQIKQNGQWQVVDWSAALNFAASKLGEILANHGSKSLAAFASPSSTTEEFYILQKWMRALKVENMDHRLRQSDFSMDGYSVQNIKNSIKYAEVENQSAVFLFGTHLKREVPMAAARVRKAFLNGAKIASLNVANYQSPFDVDVSIVDEPHQFLSHLLSIMVAMKLELKDAPDAFKSIMKSLKPHANHKAVAELLVMENAVIITGAQFENHPHYSQLRACLSWITQHSAVKWLHFPQGANANGAWQAGFVPGPKGLNIEQSLSKGLKAYILHGVEPSLDFANAPLAKTAMKNADFVLAVTSFKTDDLLEVADVILPMASFAETSGTFVNIDEQWQSFEGAADVFEKARPAWKIYRVLGNLTHCDGFEYTSSQEILAELKECPPKDSKKDYSFLPENLPASHQSLVGVNEVPLYGVDMLVRHSKPLQESAAVDQPIVKVHPKLAEKLKLGSNVTVSQNNNEITLPLELDERLHEGVVLLPAVGAYSYIRTGQFETVSLKS